ncbi:uncharacterized protein [Diadema setosum]|uniref:uncharacterized protein n=1 Tax=Diadema setosum TaxID=31175 RepID=UPI003B3B372F
MAPSCGLLLVALVAVVSWQFSVAQETCVTNLCPNGENCFNRPNSAESAYACECENTRVQRYDCSLEADNGAIATCYGTDCRSGFFISPNFPSDYNAFDSRLYLLFVPEATGFTFTFNDQFWVEADKDDLYIGPGLGYGDVANIRNEDQPNLDIYHFVGTELPDSFTLDNTDSAWFFFATDKNIQGAGFNISWSAIVDNTPPTLVCPDNILLTVGPSAASSVPVTWAPATASDTYGIASLVSSPPSGSNFVAGGLPTTVTYTATDNNGNQNTCTFTVQVLVDSIAPVFTFCPADIEITVDSSANGQIVTWEQPSATDNSGIAPTISDPNVPSGTFFATGSSVTIIYTATDAYGNQQQCTFTVSVMMEDAVDNTPPTLVCPDNILLTVGPSAGTMVPVTWEPATATDVSGIASLVSSPPSGSNFVAGGQLTTVTYTATDNNGNQNTCTFTVQVLVDSIAPVFTFCPDDIEITVGSSVSGQIVTWEQPSATDNSGIAPTISDPNFPSGTFFATGSSVTIMYTATDAYGNQQQCTFTVSVMMEGAVDNTPPTLVCPDNILLTVGPSAGTMVPVTWEPATATDVSGIASLVSSPPSGSNFVAGGQLTTVTYTATDNNGNQNTCTFTVQVLVDSIAPVFTFCPDDIEITVDSSANGQIITWEQPSATDNSGIAPTISDPNFPSGTFFATGSSATIVYTATDPYGNQQQCTFTVSVMMEGAVDNTPPTLVCPDNILLTVGPSAGTMVPVTWEPATATDVSGIASLVSSPPSGSNFVAGGQLTTVTYTATDNNGNQNTCTFTVQVLVDSIAPVFTFCPADIEITVDSSANGQIVTWEQPSATDNSGIAPTISDPNFPSGTFFATGSSATIVYTATDAYGNQQQCTFTVSVMMEGAVDNTPPTLVCPDNILLTVGPSAGTMVPVTWEPATATDVSGIASLVSSPPSGSNFVAGGQLTTVTYTATDNNGNQNTCTFTVQVLVDSIAPVFTFCPADIEITVDSSANGQIVTWEQPSATDNSGIAPTISDPNFPSGTFFATGSSVTIMYTATDAYGNQQQCTFTVSVMMEGAVDNTPPTLVCPDNILLTVGPSAGTMVPVTWEPATATDVSGIASLVSSPPSGSNFVAGGQLTTVTYTATDNNGNQNTCTFTVQVLVDSIAPVFTFCPDDIEITVDSSANGQIVTWEQPSATDNSGIAPTISNPNFPSGTFFATGSSVTIMYTATDAYGNQQQCTFTVSVMMEGAVDSTPPTLVCPGNILQTVGPSAGAFVSVTWAAATATDASGIASLVSSPPSGSNFVAGGQPTTVTYIATDNNGNQNTCSFTVQVLVDSIAPVFTFCPTNIQINVGPLVAGQAVTWQQPTATDNSGFAPTISAPNFPSGTFFTTGSSNTIVYTATDAYGNSQQCTFTVTVTMVDTTIPTVDCPDGTGVGIELGLTSTAVFFEAPTATDDSNVVNIAFQSHTPGDTFSVGSTQVTYIFQDPSGNQANCVFEVTVFTVDTTPPVPTCPANIIRTIELGQTSIVVTWIEPTATDISGVANIVSRTSNSGDSFSPGTTDVIYTFADGSGNTASCTFAITVQTQDTTGPVVTCPPNIVSTVELGVTSTAVTWNLPTATDVSGVAVFQSSTHSPGSTFNIGATDVTYVYADGLGNTGSCTFRVTVQTQDTIGPVVTCPPNIVSTVELGVASTAVTWNLPTATDASGVAVIQSSTHNPGNTFNIGVTDVTYVYADGSGNTGSCTFTVTVQTQDTIGPVVTCPPNIVSTVELGVASTAVTWTLPTATDTSGVAVIQSSTHNPGNTFNIGVTDVTYVYADGSGNTGSCTFTVTVQTQDTIGPVVTCPPNIVSTVELGVASTAVTWTLPTATDTSGVAVIQSSTHNPGNTFNIGVTDVTYVYADGSGNTGSCTFTVTVQTQDTIGPVVTCPPNIVSTVELGVASTAVTWNLPTATDVSGVAVIQSSTHNPGSTFNVGVTDVTYVYADGSGNTGSCTFTVTVQTQDTTGPVVTCPTNRVSTVELGVTSTAVTWNLPTATDVSGVAVIQSSTHNPGSTFNIGVTDVTYVYADGSGNTGSCTFTVTVQTQDTTGPVVTCPTNRVSTVELGVTSTAVTWNLPTATDVSGVTVFQSSTHTSGSAFNVGVTDVTYVYADGSGNTGSCTFTVTVQTQDTTGPVVTCPTNRVSTVELGVTSTAVTWNLPTATDVSGVAVFQSSTHSPGSTFNVGVTDVTYVYADGSGNTGSCTFTVTVQTQDTTGPVVTCPPNIVSTVELGVTSTAVTWTLPTATDVSGVAVFQSSTHSPGSTFNVGVTDVTYVYADGSGNTGSCTFTVTVQTQDTTGPVVTCPPNIVRTVELGVTSTAVTWTLPTATDVSGVTVFQSSTHTSGSTFNVGVTDVTYVYADGSGNTGSCTFTVTVQTQDTTGPVVTCPPNIVRTVELGVTSTAVTWTLPTATDVSGVTVFQSSTHTSGSAFNVGVTDVTYVYADGVGNTGSCTFTVTVQTQDTTGPVVTCPPNIVSTVELGVTSTAVTWNLPTATDVSGVAVIQSSTHNPGSTFNVGVTDVTYVYADGSGNTGSCTFTVTVQTQDTIGPVVTCPPNIVSTVELGVTSTAVTWNLPTATDTSGVAVIQSTTHNPGSTFNIGVTDVTYVYADGSGNTGSCTFTVTVQTQDTIGPVVTCPPNIVSTVELGVTSTAVTWNLPTATDVSGVAVIQSSTHNPGSTFNVGVTDVTYVYADGSGNTGSCTFTVTVQTQDTTGPVVTCPTNIVSTVELGVTSTAVTWNLPTATDVSGVTVFQSSTHSPGSTFNVGVTDVTYVYADGSGNTGSCTFTVTVQTQDTTGPVVTCPTNIVSTVELGVTSTAVTWNLPTATDVSGVTVFQSSTHSPGSTFNVGVTDVTYVYADGSGNTGSCTFTVTVQTQDTTGPVVTCPPNIVSTVELGVTSTAVTWNLPTATDVSGVAVIQSSTHNPGSTFNVGVTDVTYVYADGSGNTGSCTFTVTVQTQDTTGPVVTCPTNVVSTVELGVTSTAVTWNLPTATDVSGVTVFQSSTHSPGSTFNVGVTDVTYVYADGSGNTGSCTFTVTVQTQDTTGPVVTCPTNIVSTVELGVTSTAVTWSLPTATDVSGVTFFQSSTHSPGSTFNVGVTDVTYVYADGSGNTGSCTFTVTVQTQDTTGPVVTCPPNIVSTVELGVTSTAVTWNLPTATDVSGVAVIQSSTHNPGSTFNVGVTDVTYVYADGSGNTGSCTFTVTVQTQDTIGPVVTCPPNIVSTVELGVTSTAVTWNLPTATDASGVAVIQSSTHNPGSTFNVGVTDVTYVYADGSGNTGSCTFTVTVQTQDTIGPVVTCPPNIVSTVELGVTSTAVTWNLPTATDASGVAVIQSSTHNPGSTFNVGVTDVTYVYADGSGNTGSCTFTVTVQTQDTTGPVVTCPPNIVSTVELGVTSTAVTWNLPTATDVSGVTVFQSSTHNPGSTFNVGVSDVTYVYADGSGNTGSCTFTVTVQTQDTTGPVVTCPPNIVSTVELGVTSTAVTWNLPTATDVSGVAVIQSSTHNPGSTFNVGVTDVTYVYADGSGNTGSCTFTVTVQTQDTIGPVVTCPPNIVSTVELGVTSTAVTWNLPTATDVSGVAVIQSSTHSPGNSFNVGVTDVTYVYADGSGNTGSCTFTVTVQTQDTIPPVPTCPADITRTIELGTTSIVVTWIEPTATDISGVANIQSRTSNSGDSFSPGATDVIYTFVDGSGNTASCTFTVTVLTQDTIPPVPTCPADITRTIELGTPSIVVTWIEPTATDNSGVANIQSRTSNSGDSFSPGATDVIYTFVDGSGNTASCTFTITVGTVDTTPPVPTCPADITRTIELGTSSIVVTWIEPTATDNSGVANIQSRTSNSGDRFSPGTTDVIYTFVDGSGNTASCTFTVTVGTELLSIPYSQALRLRRICSEDSEFSFHARNLKRHLAARGYGTRRVQQAINKVRSLPRSEVLKPKTNKQDTTDRIPLVTTFHPNLPSLHNILRDNHHILHTSDRLSQAVPDTPILAYRRPHNLKDLIVRTEVPSLTDNSSPLQHGTFKCSASRCIICSIHIHESDSFTSNSTGLSHHTKGNITCTTTNVVYLITCRICRIQYVGETKTTLKRRFYGHRSTVNTAKLDTPVGHHFNLPDHSITDMTLQGIESLGTRPDTVRTSREKLWMRRLHTIQPHVDTIPPTLVCPNSITDTTFLGNTAGITVTWVEPTVTDISNNVVVTSNFASGDTFPVGNTVVTYTATDASSNSAQCSFTVTIMEVDTVPPTILNCPQEAIAVAVSFNQNQAVVNWPVVMATDNSNTQSVTQRSHSSGDVFPVGPTTVTITFSDESGNTAQCVFEVVVYQVDSTAPQIIGCPGDMTRTLTLEQNSVQVFWTAPTASDNSGNAPTITSNFSPGDSFGLGEWRVVYTVTDEAGNSVQCTFTITVIREDNVPPQVQCPADITSIVLAGTAGEVVTWNMPTVSDNSGVVIFVSSTANPGDFFPIGGTTVIYNYQDPSGNTNFCSFTVTINVGDPCSPDPCLNGGQCVREGLDSFRCICTDCFTGQTCATPIDPCAQDLCENGAACIPVPGSCVSYTCQCPACFTGPYCTEAIDSCENHQCQNGGACTIDPNDCETYTCTCPLCYTGQFCEIFINPCDNHLCQNGAQCIPVGPVCTEYQCACSGCFTGAYCEDARDPCVGSPCQNNGQCSAITTDANCFSYTCDCVGCFTGYNCEIADPSPCLQNPCQNQGVCQEISGLCSAYQCVCPAGFGGVNCEIVISENANPCNSFPCANGGECLTLDSQFYTCLCRDGYAGINCQQMTAAVPGFDSCNANPCQNGATCYNSYHSNDPTPTMYTPQYYCMCAQGFTGTNCQLPTVNAPALDICQATNPNRPDCQNGGTCHNSYESVTGDVDYICDCLPTFIGHNCETIMPDPCTSDPCENNGICTSFDTYYTCQCQTGFSGDRCQTVIDDTPPTITGCPSDITRNLPTGSTSLPITWTPPQAFDADAGGTVTLESNLSPGDLFTTGTTPVVYVATNAAGLTTTCTFDVTVTSTIDAVPPVINGCPDDIFETLPSGSQSLSITWTPPVATDNSGFVNLESNFNPGALFSPGQTSVVYTATDNSGLETTCTFSVFVATSGDVTPPVITGCPGTQTATLPAGTTTVAVTWTPPQATDASPPVTLTVDRAPGSFFTAGTTMVTYTATDAVGLESACTFNVIVVTDGGDTVPPVINNCPSDRTAILPLGANAVTVSWTAPTATDNSGQVTLIPNISPGSQFTLGSTVVTYTATDGAGLQTTCSFTVTVSTTAVIDVTPPTFVNCPMTQVITVAAGVTSSTATWQVPTATDTQGQASVAATSGHSPGATFPLGTTAVVYTATDQAGLQQTCVFNIIVTSSDTGPVEDRMAPIVLSCSSVVRTADPNSDFTFVSWDLPTADDNGVVVTPSVGLTQGFFPLGQTGPFIYTFTDANNNAATCTLYVFVIAADNQDTTPPTLISCPNDVTVTAAAGASSATATWAVPTATDPSGGDLIFTSTYDPGDSFGIGTTAVSYSILDEQGNAVECNFNVIVVGSGTTPVDQNPPTINGCPSSFTVTVSAGSNVATATWTVPTAVDAEGTATVTGDSAPPVTLTAGQVRVVTYTATDTSGLQSLCTFNIIAQGTTTNQPPQLANCPNDISVTLPVSSTTISVPWTAPTATDDSGITPTITSTRQPGSQFGVGTTPVTYTATDNLGLSSTCSFNVIVTGDTTGPVINNCPSDQTAVLPAGSSTVSVSWTVPTATDSSGQVTLIPNIFPGSQFSLGPTVVTYTATNGAGQQTTCSFTVTVIASTVTDVTPPAFVNCPSTQVITVAAGVTSSTATWQVPTATDTQGQASVAATSGHSPGATFPLGTTAVVYTATDQAGLQQTCVFNIIVTSSDTGPVEDRMAPIVLSCSSVVRTADPNSDFTFVSWDLPTADDNGVVVTPSVGLTQGFFPLGQTGPFTYTFTDANNNAATCTLYVFVIAADNQDTTPPTLVSCPNDVTVTAAAGASSATATWAVPTATDPSGGDLIFTSTYDPGDSFGIGTTPVSYSILDEQGNAVECNFNVIVVGSGTTPVDQNPPTINGCPSSITVTVPAGSNVATATWTVPTAVDAEGTVTVTGDSTPPVTLTAGQVRVVTYTATDTNGLQNLCTFNIIAQGTTTNQPPRLANCPNDISVTLSASSTTVSVPWTAPTATDDSGIAPTITSTRQPGSQFGAGTTPVTYTATDNLGLSSTCSFNVIVTATTTNQPPQLANCPNDISVTLPASSTTVSVPWTAPTATDDSGITPTITSTRQPGSQFGAGTTPVTYTATDNLGLSSTCSFNVIVTATTTNQPPQLANCPNDISVTLPASSTTVSVPWTAPTATDDSGITPTITTTRQPGSQFGVGTTPVTYTATDNLGLSSTCSFNVIVTATVNQPPQLANSTVNQPPQLANCPNDISVTLPVSSTTISVPWTAPTATDDSGITPTITSTRQPGSQFGVGTTPVTYTATDNLGLSSTCSFNVIVTATTNQPPQLENCPTDISVTLPVTSTTISVPWTAPTATDDSGITPTITTTRQPGSLFAEGTSPVTYTATDNLGLSSTCSFNVIVRGLFTFFNILKGVNIFLLQPFIMMTCTIISADQIPPNIICPDNVVVNLPSGVTSGVASWNSPTVDDEQATVTSTAQSGSVFNLGRYAVAYTAVDLSGNSDECSFYVTVTNSGGLEPLALNNCPVENTPVSYSYFPSTSCNPYTEPTLQNTALGTLTSQSHTPQSDFSTPGNYFITYTFTSNAGITTQCAFILAVEEGQNVCSCQPCDDGLVCFYLDANSDQHLCLPPSARKRRSIDNGTVFDGDESCQCKNGGSCSHMGGGVSCLCREGFSGILCEEGK